MHNKIKNEKDSVRHRKPIGMAYGSKTSTTVICVSKTSLHSQLNERISLTLMLICFLAESKMKGLIPPCSMCGLNR